MSECYFQTRRSRGRLLSRLRHQETGEEEAGNNDVTENNESQEVKTLWLMDSLRTLACSDRAGNELSVKIAKYYFRYSNLTYHKSILISDCPSTRQICTNKRQGQKQ